MKRRWTDEQLISTFTLSQKEREPLSGMVSHNQLGFAVLLKFFQSEGRFPRNPSEVPPLVVEYLAKQLSVSPQIYSDYQWDGRTINHHRERIRQRLGFRPYTASDWQPLMEWLCETVLPDHQDTEAVEEIVKNHLRAVRIEPPSPSQIQRLIHSAQNTYETRLFFTISQKLPPATQMALSALLQPTEASSSASESANIAYLPLQQLKARPGAASLRTVLQAVTQLERLQLIPLPPDLFASISPKVIEHFRQRVAVEAPSQLRRHPDPIRYTLLAAFCCSRSAEITDDLVECLILIVHRLSTRAERKIDKELLEELKRVSGKTNLLFQIAGVAFFQPDGTVRQVISPVASEQTLRDLVAESRSTGPAYRLVVHRVMRKSDSSHYRRMVPKLLGVLDFRTNNTIYQPVIDALSVLRKYMDSQHVYYPPDESVPINGVVRPGWIETVVETNRGQRINRINYEMCVLSALREGLRNKSIGVAGAVRYRNPDEDLPTDFEAKRVTYYQALNQPLDAKTFTTQLQQAMHQALAMLNDNLPTNEKVRLLRKKVAGFISRRLTHNRSRVISLT